MRKLLTASIGLLLILFYCASCSHSANWHLRQAIKKGANQKIDTIYQTVEIPVPEVKTDTIFRSLQGDTVYIEKDRLKMKYVNLPGDSVFIEGKCSADTIYKEIPVTITKEIKANNGFWYYFPWLLVVIAIAAAAYFIRSFRK